MEFSVDTNNVNIIQENQVESGEFNVTTCQFSFSNEYEGLTKKAVFTGQDGIAYLETIIDGECSIPSEVLATNQVVQIGVYAYEVDGEVLLLRYSPKPTVFYIHQGSYKEAQNSTPPTPSEIEQLQAQITENANNIDGIIDDIIDINAEQTEQNTNIQNNTDNITTLQNTKADKSEIPTKISDLINDSDFVVDNNYVHTDNNFTNEDKSQISQNVTDIATLQNTKADKTEIPTKVSDLTNDSGFITKNVNDLINYTLKTNTGSLIDLEINSTTYVITLSLKDVDGNVISTDTIDLPLESVVVGGSYDAVNKKIVLTLENGNTVDIPVGDLVAGLQTEITSSNKLASDLVDDTNSGNKFVTTSEKETWNAKYDKPVSGIPDTDLSSAVQTSLGKANTAVQPTNYATSGVGGTIKISDTYATAMTSGKLYAKKLYFNQYQSADDGIFISKGTLEQVIPGRGLELTSHKVTSLSSESTDTQYPSAKCVYDLVGNVESILEELDIRGWHK